MNASPPIRTFIPTEADRMEEAEDNCCDLCWAVPVRVVLDGDKLCQACADKWARNERPDDDLLPLDHPTMKQAIARYNQAVRDAELLKLSKAHRQFNRQRVGEGR